MYRGFKQYSYRSDAGVTDGVGGGMSLFFVVGCCDLDSTLK